MRRINYQRVSPVPIIILIGFFSTIGFENYTSVNFSLEPFDRTKSVNSRAFNHKPLNWPWRGIVLVINKENEMPDSLQIKQIANVGVNFIRIRLSIRNYSSMNHTDVRDAKIKSFYYADKIIKWCAQENIAVLISHSDFPLDPKLNLTQSDNEFWDNKELLAESIDFIGEVVRQFDGCDNVVGYEFFAEPVEKNLLGRPVQPAIWNEHYKNIRNQIHKYSNKYILYSPGPWGYPSGYKSMKDTIPDNKIIYNFHYYRPHLYTHQGSVKQKDLYSYPGTISNKYWDINTIEDDIKIAYEWTKKNNQLLFCGEFGANARAEGREKYIKDVLTVLEKYEIGYAYTALNGWEGWRYDYTFDSKTKNIVKSPQKTLTQKVLEQYWGLNIRQK